MIRIASLLSFLLFVYSTGFAQKDTSQVLEAVTALREALVSKDSNAVKRLLREDVAFGHSNGWVQTKIDVLNDMRTGYLVYQKFNVLSLSIKISGKHASVQERVEVEGIRNGTAFKLPLFVLHVWIKTRKGWQLLSRQSTRIQ
jgi:ketosteroid isomerase-like protein